MLFEFAKISIVAIATGVVSMCVAGVAMASDGLASDVTPTVPTDITAPQTSVSAGTTDLSLVSSTDSTSLSTQLVSQIDTSSQPPIAPNLTASDPSNSAIDSALPTTAVPTSGVSQTTPPTLESTPVLVASDIVTIQTPAAIAVAKHAARLVAYQAVFERTNEAQNSQYALAYVPPVVSDTESGLALPGAHNTPAPIKTTGLLGDFTTALGSIFAPNSINYVLDASRHAGATVAWVLLVLVIVTVFAQGFILFVQRAGYSRAPRAGIVSPLTFATPQLMSHFVPI
jgi:hypothetical protein